ncbi:MAG: phage protease [Prevotella sp.]|nr:phage protease [Prevotella sp.]
MIKVDKEFLLTDETVNCYGYRLLTSGLQLDRFDPPIGFFMHDREKGVAVKWTDLTVRDGALYGKPVVDETRFPDLAQQIIDGFYAAASVGHIVALEWSDDPEMKLEGQTGPTVTKWFPRECSIVDIPGNYNAVAQDKLFDEGDNVLLDLSDNLNTLNFMEKPAILVEALLALSLPNLAADATPEQALEVIRELAAKASKADGLETELKNLRAEMAALKEKTDSEKIASIVEKALADHKINQAMADKLKADYKSNIAGLQALVDAMPVQSTITSQMKTVVPDKYVGKTWDDLYMSGDLADVKKNYPDLYRELESSRKK